MASRDRRHRPGWDSDLGKSRPELPPHCRMRPELVEHQLSVVGGPQDGDETVPRGCAHRQHLVPQSGDVRVLLLDPSQHDRDRRRRVGSPPTVEHAVIDAAAVHEREADDARLRDAHTLFGRAVRIEVEGCNEAGLHRARNHIGRSLGPRCRPNCGEEQRPECRRRRPRCGPDRDRRRGTRRARAPPERVTLTGAARTRAPSRRSRPSAHRSERDRACASSQATVRCPVRPTHG